MLVPSFLIVPPVTCRVLPESPGCGGMMSKRFLPEVRQACASAPALLWLGAYLQPLRRQRRWCAEITDKAAVFRTQACEAWHRSFKEGGGEQGQVTK